MTWKDRYMITSARGRVWSRREVASLCRRHVRRIWSGLPRCVALVAAVDGVLDDDGWMRRRRGETPVAVAREVEIEASWRVGQAERSAQDTGDA